MALKSNRQKECYYFELFRKVYPLPDGELKYGDKPDIIIDGKRRLGVEMTNFYVEGGELIESEQIQRRIRKIVLKKAQQKYIHKGGKFEISFSFNRQHPIRHSRKLIPKIIEIIRRLESSRTGGISKYFLEDIPELDFVYINPNLYSNPQWRNVQGYTGVNQMSMAKLEQILSGKEKKAEEYEKCDAYWLLVVIDSFDRAQEQLIPDEVLNGEVKLDSDIYEKIILFLNQEQQILHLKG
jgi:hypothetical protein